VVADLYAASGSEGVVLAAVHYLDRRGVARMAVLGASMAAGSPPNRPCAPLLVTSAA
jgi:hypothetical protein